MSRAKKAVGRHILKHKKKYGVGIGMVGAYGAGFYHGIDFFRNANPKISRTNSRKLDRINKQLSNLPK